MGKQSCLHLSAGCVLSFPDDCGIKQLPCSIESSFRVPKNCLPLMINSVLWYIGLAQKNVKAKAKNAPKAFAGCCDEDGQECNQKGTIAPSQRQSCATGLAMGPVRPETKVNVVEIFVRGAHGADICDCMSLLPQGLGSKHRQFILRD